MPIVGRQKKNRRRLFLKSRHTKHVHLGSVMSFEVFRAKRREEILVALGLGQGENGRSLQNEEDQQLNKC
jgi:hypothetical protein